LQFGVSRLECGQCRRSIAPDLIRRRCRQLLLETQLLDVALGLHLDAAALVVRVLGVLDQPVAGDEDQAPQHQRPRPVE
jgi:hypothetical protein